jgi:hypothetical protein
MITFALTGHRRRLRMLVHGFLFLAWAAGEAGVLAAWRSEGGAPVAVAAGTWTFLGILILWNAFREGAGRETLTVQPPLLVHRRAVGPWVWRRTYDLRGILRPRAERTTIPPFRLFRVEFDYNGRIRRFGGGLTATEADCIVAMILRAQESAPAGR